MEKLKLEDFQDNKELVLDFLKIHDECVIDINEEISKPPIAISIGSGYDGDIPLVTYGNFCCIVGASKSMKSFLKSALLACYIGGQSQNYFSDIKGHDTKGKYIIDIDTEQGKYHVQKVVKRVNVMIGGKYEGYKGFALRPKDPKERVAFIDWILKESKLYIFNNNIDNFETKNQIEFLQKIYIDYIEDLINNTVEDYFKNLDSQEIIERYKIKRKDLIKYWGKNIFKKYFLKKIANTIGELKPLNIINQYCTDEYLRDFQDNNQDLVPIRALSYEGFYTYFAFQQKQLVGKKAISAQLKTNPHPLDKYRCNIPLSRSSIFRALYHVKKGDGMWWHNTDTVW